MDIDKLIDSLEFDYLEPISVKEEKEISYKETKKEKRRDRKAARQRHYNRHRKEIIEKVKAYRRVKKYNLTKEDFEAKLAAQLGCCAICRTGDPGNRGWMVDHSHYSNITRGLLCQFCNSMIGFARENTTTLLLAIDYLTRYKKLEL